MQHAGIFAPSLGRQPATAGTWARLAHSGWAPYCVLTAVVLTHFGLALVLSERPLAAYLDRTWLADITPFFVLPVALWLGGVMVLLARRGARSPLRALRLVLFLNRVRLLRTVLLLALYVVTSRAYRAIKVALPRHVDFYADPSLAQLDRMLFGTDPWRLTHALIGPGGTWLIDRLYVLWLPIMVAMFAWSAFTSDRAFQLRSAVVHFLIWIVLGNLLALGLASAGPCFYLPIFGNGEFEPLMDRLAQVGDLNALALQDYLLGTRGVESIGAGISAAPSVHVAMTVLLVLMMHDRFGARWPTWLAGGYLAAIWLGSVHLGWHYAVDGLISLMLVPLMWWSLGRVPGFATASHRRA